jgi:hypothetical protein
MSPTEESPAQTPGFFMRAVRNLTAVVAVIAAVFGAITASAPAMTVWCMDFGTLCTFSKETFLIKAQVSPGNPCNNAAIPLCVERSNKKRALDTQSFKFLRQVAPGQFEETQSSNPSDGAGWIVDPKNSPNPAKICVIVLAHTTACEHDKFSITGKLFANETQPLSSLWSSDVLGR